MAVHDFTSTVYAPDDTIVWAITYTQGRVGVEIVDPVKGHEREVGIRAAVRYLSSKGKPWNDFLP